LFGGIPARLFLILFQFGLNRESNRSRAPVEGVPENAFLGPPQFFHNATLRKRRPASFHAGDQGVNVFVVKERFTISGAAS
jgi:hypothetical protein